MERYNDIRGDPPYPFNLTSIRSFSSLSPITMSTSCPLGITEVLHIGVCRQGPALRFRLCNVRHLRSSFQILPFQLLHSLTELVCQICTFYRDDRSFFFAILCAFGG